MVEIEGPHLLPQGEQRRAAATGRKLNSRSSASLVVIFDPVSSGWCFYLDSDPKQAIVIPVDQVGPLVKLLSDG